MVLLTVELTESVNKGFEEALEELLLLQEKRARQVHAAMGSNTNMRFINR
jgi:hypothetical protein